MIRFLLPAFFVIGLSAPSSRAVRPYQPNPVDPVMESSRWQSFPQLDGKGFQCMAEAKDGTLWFGLSQGWMSYDGREWKTYPNDNGFLLSRPACLLAARDGNLYAGSRTGVSCFKNGSWILLFPKVKTPRFNYITSLLEASDGSLWVSTMRGALRIQNGIQTFYTYPSSADTIRKIYRDVRIAVVPNPAQDTTSFDVYSVFEDREKQIWFGLWNGRVVRHNPRAADPSAPAAWHRFTEREGLHSSFRPRFLQTLDGTIWIVSDNINAHIHQYRRGKWTSFQLSKMGGLNINRSILQTRDGAVWIGGFGELYRFQNGSWDIYKKPSAPIPSPRIELMETTDGSLWIAGLDNEVLRLDYSTPRWTTLMGLNFQCETPDGAQWFTDAEGGVVRRQGDRWMRYGTEDGLMDRPFSLISTRGGQLWAAGSHRKTAATAFFEKGRWIRQTHPRLSWCVDYRALFEARDGTLWFGAGSDTLKGQQGGVIRFDPSLYKQNPRKAWKHHTRRDGGPIWVYGINQAGDGSLLFADVYNLCRFDGRQWSVVTISGQAGGQKRSDCLDAASDGRIWVGTRGYGVYRFDGAGWTGYNLETGLLSNTVTHILAASDSSVWVATEKDISRFDGRGWFNRVFPESMNIQKEGGSLKQSKDGAIWINRTSRSWFRLSHPGSYPEGNTHSNFWTVRFQPETGIPETGIALYEKKVSQPGNAIFSWKGSDPWEVTSDDALQYSYRLDGGPWSLYSPEKNHIFLSLPTGKHTLDVRARDKDFNVDPTPASVRFTVAPPFWRHPAVLFLSTLLLLSVGTGIALVLKRDAKLREVNSALETSNKELDQSNRELDQSNRELEQARELLTQTNLDLQELNVKLERSNEDLEQFAYVASHDLQEPLRMVSSYMALLERRIQDKLDQDSREFMQFAVDGSSRMQQLINDLLSYSRVTTKGKPFEPTDSEEVFGAVLKNLEVAIGESGAKVSHDPLPVVTADGGQIARLFQNLVGNAIKYRDPQKTPEVHVSAEKKGAEWVFSILDNGIGIDLKYHTRIFGVFQRLHTREQYPGTGIGLAVCKKIVERHNGEIWVESQEGKGSTFYFSLPA